MNNAEKGKSRTTQQRGNNKGSAGSNEGGASAEDEDHWFYKELLSDQKDRQGHQDCSSEIPSLNKEAAVSSGDEPDSNGSSTTYSNERENVQKENEPIDESLDAKYFGWLQQLPDEITADGFPPLRPLPMGPVEPAVENGDDDDGSAVTTEYEDSDDSDINVDNATGVYSNDSEEEEVGSEIESDNEDDGSHLDSDLNHDEEDSEIERHDDSSIEAYEIQNDRDDEEADSCDESDKEQNDESSQDGHRSASARPASFRYPFPLSPYNASPMEAALDLNASETGESTPEAEDERPPRPLNTDQSFRYPSPLCPFNAGSRDIELNLNDQQDMNIYKYSPISGDEPLRAVNESVDHWCERHRHAYEDDQHVVRHDERCEADLNVESLNIQHDAETVKTGLPRLGQDPRLQELPTFCILPPLAPAVMAPLLEEDEVGLGDGEGGEVGGGGGVRGDAEEMSSMGQDVSPMPQPHEPLQELREYRLEKGRCMQCGTQLFKKKTRRKGFLGRKKETVYKGLDIDGVVTRGQCIRCMNDQHVEATSAAARSTDNAAATPQTVSNPRVYIGAYDMFGRPSGQGELLYPNGDRYRGTFLNGVRHGEGTLCFADGSEYVGSFENDQMSGQGTRRYPDGTIYSGEFRNGLCSGQGRCYYANGDLAVGHWERNQLEGVGRYYYNNRHLYIGHFCQGRRHGGGTYMWEEGKRRMVFLYENDKRVGLGVRLEPNKRKAWVVSNDDVVARLAWEEAIVMANMILMDAATGTAQNDMAVRAVPSQSAAS